MKLRFDEPDLKVKALTVRFLPDGKVLVKLGESNFHYTLHPGHASGTIDLHKTDERLPRSDPSRYESLGAISKSAIEEELRTIGPRLLGEFVNLWRPLRLGWMIRRRLCIGARLPTDLELKGGDGISVKAGPALCPELLASWMKPPEFYEDILCHPNAAYLLFDGKKPSSVPYGTVFTYKGKDGYVRMMWVRDRDLRHWARRWEPVLLAAWDRLHERSVG